MCFFRVPLGRRCASLWVSACARAPRCSPSTRRERGDTVRMRRFPRPNMRRVVIVVPSLFTLFNLFFGIWSMVLASRGEFYRAAGMTLATFYPFTTTGLWQEVARYLPRHHTMQLLVILLTILMVSNVRYATLPRAGLRTARGLLGLATILFILSFGVLEHDAFL